MHNESDLHLAVPIIQALGRANRGESDLGGRVLIHPSATQPG